MSKYKTGQIYLRSGFHYLVTGQKSYDNKGRLLLHVVSLCSSCGHFYQFLCPEGLFQRGQRKRCDRCKQPGKKAAPWPDAKEWLERIK